MGGKPRINKLSGIESNAELMTKISSVKSLVLTIKYEVEPEHVNVEDVLDYLRQSGAAVITDVEANRSDKYVIG